MSRNRYRGQLTVNVKLIGILMYLITMASTGYSQLSYIYVEKTGEITSRFEWRIAEQSPVKVSVLEKNKEFISICQPNGWTEEWRYISPTDTLTITRNENVLTFSGTRENKIIQRKEEIDSAPWFQALSYSLSQWLKQGGEKTYFWTIRPDDITAHKLMARKQKLETIEVANQAIKAVPVKVSLSGAISLFWSVTYWFKADDYLFVKYEGVHGPPGTDKTVVELESKIR